MDMRIMSFNIRCGEFTPERTELVIQMINTYKPSSVGFQEATDGWVNALVQGIGDEYGCVSCGRNADRHGEATPVFYLKSRFKAVESGTKWMSDTPDVPGSKIQESSLPRIFTYVLLEEIGTGGRCIHVNTHLEHTSEEARIKQINVLIKEVKKIGDKNTSLVLTGDFNCYTTETTYEKVIDSGLTDAMTIAKKKEEGPTYHGYGKASELIDFIFVESEKTEVDFYRVCTETFLYSDGSIAYPSDHNPVIIDAKFI